MRSSSRQGRRQRLLALHTTEGILTVGGLREFFNRPNAAGSSHAAADATGALAEPEHGYVPYEQAAWTLRNGNPISDNLEMCAFAGWTRAQFLERPKLLEAAARWLAKRSRATDVPLVKRSPTEVKFGLSGVIGHVDWTQGMKDGSHWDPGPGFPWDVVLKLANTYAAGRIPAAPVAPIEEDYDVITFVSDGDNRPWWKFNGFEIAYCPPGEPQRLVDLGQARSNTVKLIPPAVLTSYLAASQVTDADVARIVNDVAARFASMTAEQRKAEVSYAVPTAAFVETDPAPVTPAT